MCRIRRRTRTSHRDRSALWAGAILGSDSDRAKDARFGHEYIFPEPAKALKAIAGLGLYSPAWERVKYPTAKAVGRFEPEFFDPEKWKSNYPNPAFLSRQPDDEYWAAKQVMAFTDEDIRAIVETGQYSDPKAAEYVAGKMETFGLEAAGTDGYLQQVKFETRQLIDDQSSIALVREGGHRMGVAFDGEAAGLVAEAGASPRFQAVSHSVFSRFRPKSASRRRCMSGK